MHVETTQHPCGGDRPIQQTEVAVAAAAAAAAVVFVQDFAQGWMLFSVELPSVCSLNSLLNSQLTVVITNKHCGSDSNSWNLEALCLCTVYPKQSS